MQNLPLPTLCDADVIIDAHALGVWDALVRACPIAVPGTVARTEVLKYPVLGGARRLINLVGQAGNGVIRIVDATQDDLDAVDALLDDRILRGSLDSGEFEALAIVLRHTPQHDFCTCDTAATKALCHLNLAARGVSFETLLRRVRLQKPMDHRLSERAFQARITKGMRERREQQR